MKHLYTLILVALCTTSFAQYIDGPANIRTAPNEDKLFSVNDYVWVRLETEQPINNWYEIELHCYVLPNDLVNKTTIKANSTLLNYDGDSIGFSYTQFEIENHNENYYAYDDLDKIEISVVGQTFKSNIRHEITNAEILANKKSFADSCFTTYLNYQEECGQWITLIEKCSMYPASIMINGERESVLVKQNQRIKQYNGAEGQYSIIELAFIDMNYKDNPVIKEFSVEADRVDIAYPLIKAVKYGCCGGEDEWQVYNSQTLEKIMEYDVVMYDVRIPNSKTVGYFGYKSLGYINNETAIGQLVFSDGKDVRNIVKFATNDKNKFDNILRFVPDMEFKPIHERDKTRNDGSRIDLWSQNGNKESEALTGFKFLVHLVDDTTGKDYVQELTITNGYINGNREKEFTIWID